MHHDELRQKIVERLTGFTCAHAAGGCEYCLADRVMELFWRVEQDIDLIDVSTLEDAPRSRQLWQRHLIAYAGVETRAMNAESPPTER